MNTLYEEEIQGHHSMRDLVLSLVSDDDLAYTLPGRNPSLGELLLQLGDVEGVYTHSFETSTLDWTHRHVPHPSPITVAALRAWFDAQDAAMRATMDGLSVEELQVDRIDRGDGFIASPFVQHEIYREAVYIFYGKLSVYLRALGIDAGPVWGAWVG